MKKTISIILSALIIISCFTITTVSATDYNAKITLNGSTYTYKEGTQVTYTCNLQVNDVIENGEFSLNYPSEILKINSIEFPITTDAVYNYQENVKNALKFNFTRASEDINDLYNFKENAVLVHVTFDVISCGSGEISLDKLVLSNNNSINALTKATFNEAMSKSNYTNPKINCTKRNLYVKNSFTLKVSGGSAQKTSWKSSNTKVATVTSSGKVVAKKAGKTTITATKDGVKMNCSIVVKNPTVKAKKTTIKLKKSTTITVKNAVGKTKYKSLTNKIAKVTSKGKVTGLKKGTAKIQVIASGVKFVVKIKVKK